MSAYAVVWMPEFRLQALLRQQELLGQPGAWSDPLVLLSDETKQAVVMETTPSAVAAGIALGMTATQAQARCGRVRVLARVEAAERVTAAILLTHAQTLSAWVEETAAGRCTCDLSGSDPDLLQARGERVVKNLAEGGLRARVGLGGSPRLAYYAAVTAAEGACVNRLSDSISLLQHLPLAWAEPDPDHQAVLQEWGVHTCAEMSNLPRAEIARRLGPRGASLWDRAAGREDRVLKVATATPVYEEEVELEHEIETIEPLLFLLQRFLESLAARIEATYQAIIALKLSLRMADGQVYTREFNLPEPTTAAPILFRVLHTHLDQLQTSAPLVGARLTATPGRVIRRQGGLFEQGLNNPHRFAETLSRVLAIVGNSHAGWPVAMPTHKPDSFELRPSMADSSSTPERRALPRMGPPLRRFRPSPPANLEWRNGRPAAVRSSIASGSVIVSRGPWKLSGQWWDQERWSTEGWDVELDRGGLYLVSRWAGEWRLEGIYD